MSIPVGNLAVSRVIEYDGPLFIPDELLPDLTSERLAVEQGWMVPDFYDPVRKRLVSCVQSYAFRTRHHAVLVDTCVGNGKTGRRNPLWNGGDWPYLENLAAAGFRPEAIDFVILTHLHVDHVGWNARLLDGRWVPTFPNAKYLIVKREFAYLQHLAATTPQYKQIYEDSIRPILDAGQVVFVENDHELDDSVRLAPSPGHTPGHVSVHIRSKGTEAVIAGDVLHHPLQRLHPDWNSRACEDGEQARKTRRRLYEESADRDVLVLAAHFSPCRIASTREGFDFRYV